MTSEVITNPTPSTPDVEIEYPEDHPFSKNYKSIYLRMRETERIDKTAAKTSRRLKRVALSDPLLENAALSAERANIRAIRDRNGTEANMAYYPAQKPTP